jgi:hypothetical protein
MGGRTKAKQADALARLDAGNSQAAEADDSGTEQRSSIQIVKRTGQREDEIRTSENIFRISAGDGVAGEGRRVAEILLSSFAEGAGAVCAAEPADTDARAEWNFFSVATDNFADDLMAGNHARLSGSKFSFDDMQICAAHTAGTHSKKDMSGLELRICDVSDSQRVP